MKKIFGKICLVLFIVSLYATPASAALKIDAAQLSGVVNKYVTKIMEATEKVTQQINQVKLMATQGYNWDSLKDLAKEYYKKNGDFNMTQVKDLVKGTKAKKLKEEEAKAETYTQGSIDLYEQKKEIAKKALNESQEELSTVKNKIAQQEKKCNSLQSRYNQLETQEAGSGEEIVVELAECKSELETLKNNAIEWEAQAENLEKTIKNIDETLEKFKNNEDDVQKANAQRIELLSQDQDEKDTVKKVEDNTGKEWDSEGALDSYQVTDQEYSTFMKNYFYDFRNLNADANKGAKAGTDKGVAYENYINRILRNRRYLFVNTAVHLMQVTTTTRRELPQRIETADTMFEQTLKGDELSALIAYSNARLENAKALFLYAKLLSAKIQYLAARDLLNAELRKEIYDEEGQPKKYEEFNLEKYILTEEYVKKMQAEANKTISTKDLENVDNKMKWSESNGAN